MADLRTLQDRAWAIKLAKGFGTTDVPREFCLLYGEVAEAFDAWRRDADDLPGELADIAIYLMGLARMCGVDLQQAVEDKLIEVEGRVYRPLPNGTMVKVSTE